MENECRVSDVTEPAVENECRVSDVIAHATFNQLYSLFKYMYVLKYNLNFFRLMFPMQILNQNVCKVYLLTRICLHVISVVLLMKLFQSFKLTCCVYSSALEVV